MPLKIVTRDIYAYERFFFERLSALEEIQDVTSSVALSDFMANLKGSRKFKDVDLVESRQDLTKSPRTITFEVTCRFEV